MSKVEEHRRRQGQGGQLPVKKVKWQLIQRIRSYLDSMKIEYLFAPFESDAQLSYFCRKKIVDFVISEDSDLIIYGCSRLLVKLRKFRGDFFDIKKVEKILGKERKIYVGLALLAGCDYTSFFKIKIKQVGLIRALKLLNENEGNPKKIQLSLEKTNIISGELE